MREDSRTEFKREYTSEIRRTVIAFANCNGGRIYIGIDDEGQIVGVDDADEVMLKIASNIKDSITPDVSLITEISTRELEGRAVVQIEVMRGTARPYYLSAKGPRPEGVFVRSGAATVPADSSVILELIKASCGYSYEKELSVLQKLSFEYAAGVFETCGLAFNNESLRKLNAINENGQYTNLALLISDQCPHIIKLASFQGYDKRIFRDRLVADGSVFKQIDTATDFIAKYNRLRAEIVDYRREDSYDYSMDCIREMLYNAVIHRDYSYDSPIIISILEDRIETVNIGGLYGNLEESELGTGISACRNKNLAELFYRLKLVEAFGTGIMKINSAYEGCSRQPSFKAGHNSFRAILPNMNIEKELAYENMLRERRSWNSYNAHSLQDTRNGTAIYSANSGRLQYAQDSANSGRLQASRDSLSERELAALALAKAKGMLVRSDLEASLEISQATAILLLRDLCSRGLLTRLGAGKNTRYSLAKGD